MQLLVRSFGNQVIVEAYDQRTGTGLLELYTPEQAKDLGRQLILAATQARENRVHTERMAPLPEGSTVGEVEAS